MVDGGWVDVALTVEVGDEGHARDVIRREGGSWCSPEVSAPAMMSFATTDGAIAFEDHPARFFADTGLFSTDVTAIVRPDELGLRTDCPDAMVRVQAQFDDPNADGPYTGSVVLECPGIRGDSLLLWQTTPD